MATKPRTAAQRAGTLFTSLEKDPEPDVVFRLLYARYMESLPVDTSGIILSVDATAGRKPPYLAGELGFLHNPDEMNAPLYSTSGYWRLGGNRYWESSAPVSFAAGQVTMALRRSGASGPQGHVLFSHGRDFFVTWDEKTSLVAVFHPDGNTGNASFGVKFFRNIPFPLSQWQILSVALHPNSIVLTVNGTVYREENVPIGSEESTALVRFGFPGEGTGGAHIEVKSVELKQIK